MTVSEASSAHQDLLSSLLPFNHGEWAHANLTRLSLFLKNPRSLVEPELLERFIDAVQTFSTKTTVAVEQLLARCSQFRLDQPAVEQLHIHTVNLRTLLAKSEQPDEELAATMLKETEGMKEAIRLVRQSTLRFFQASPTEILQSVLASMQIRLQNDGISIKRTHEDVSTTVCITPELLSAVLGSLCNHALEYMQTSKQRTLEIHSYEKALWWVVEIKDSGRGIPLDQWKEVFGNTGSSGSDRLSLGAIRETLRLFEGEIAIKESIVGKGTTMLLRLKKI